MLTNGWSGRKKHAPLTLDVICQERRNMGYIITAEVFTDVEENLSGNASKVNARILSESDGTITFDIRGDFYKQKELTKKLCNTLIDAGFVSFTIGHSY